MEVSIIIPHYNSILTLFRLLDSIPEKKEIEIIVIDDKSNKEQIDIIKKSIYMKRIKFFLNEGKKGAGNCRNIGLKNATKKWVLFADADDFFCKNFYNLLKEEAEESKEIIYFKPLSCYSDTLKKANRNLEFCKMIEQYENTKSSQSLNDLKYNWVVPWSKLIKLEIIIKNNILFDDCIAANDVMFSIRLAEKSEKLKISNKSIYYVTINRGSLTLNRSEENFDSRFEVLKQKNKFFLEKKLDFYITPGISYLIASKNFGIKKFFKVFKYTISNLKYFFNGRKKWIILAQNAVLFRVKNKKYLTKNGI